MQIVIVGAGTLGTLYGVRLARAGHAVLLVARGQRATELRESGATIEQAVSGARDLQRLPVTEVLQPDVEADLCVIAIRREQLAPLMPTLEAAHGIKCFLLLMNFPGDPERVFSRVGRQRVVLGFPGAAGSIENGVVRYVDIPQQPTAIEATSPAIAAALRAAGFRTSTVRDMPSWLKRHALFVTAVCAALYQADGDARRLSSSRSGVRELILAIRQGWQAMDGQAIAPEPVALRAIFRWVPLPFAIRYWQKLLSPPLGEYYFAKHARHAIGETAALAREIRQIVPPEAAPRLYRLYEAIDRAALR